MMPDTVDMLYKQLYSLGNKEQEIKVCACLE